MHTPNHFLPPNQVALTDLIRAYPLATLVIHSANGLNANHIPFYWSASPAPHGALQGHTPRANDLREEIGGGIEALAVFQGPAAYITPSWYATKQQTGRVVPTWNYAVVHAHGVLRLVDDPSWLRAQLESLTRHNEASLAQPWSVGDAPAEYFERLMGAIVGIEMVITRQEGKWKLSQNQPAQNQAGVIAGLRARGNPGDDELAKWVEVVVPGPPAAE